MRYDGVKPNIQKETSVNSNEKTVIRKIVVM